MAELQLDEVKSALTGVWDFTRARFWIGAAESAARGDDWETVASRLLKVADPMDSAVAPRRAWRELAVAALEASVRAGSEELVLAVAGEMLDRAWDEGAHLVELRPVLALAERPERREAGFALAKLLERWHPRSALTGYARAHFDELRARAEGGASDAFDAARIAAGFERAAELFEARDDARSAVHCRLRAAVVWMTWTSQTDRARRMLREVGDVELSASERRWLAFARAHSPFWLDRVRAADWVGDTLDDAGTTGVSERDVRSAYAVADVLFSRLPVQLSDPERDRLEALLDEFEADQRWEYEAQLRGRDAAREAAQTPLEQMSSVDAAELEKESLPLDGFAAIAAAWSRQLPADRPRSPVASLVVDLLTSLTQSDERAATEAVRKLARTMADTPDARDYRPISMALLRACEEDVESPQFRAAITEMAVYYAKRAPAPSFGFVSLASALFAGGYWRAGAAATLRGLQEGDVGDHELCELTVARSVQWAVRDGTDREMLDWLERAEKFFGDS